MNKRGWEVKKLGEVCEIISGSTPKTNIEDYWNGEYNWITPAELNERVDVIYETERKITQKAIKDTGLRLLPKGTVLLSSRAPIGKVALAGSEMYCNQGFKNLVCSDEIHNRYLFRFLKGKTVYLNSLGRGATFKEISKTIVANIPVPVPPLSTQEQIVKELDTLSEIIEKKKKQLAELDTLAQATFYEMFGHPIVNEKGWEEKPINTVSSSIVPGRDKPKGFTGKTPWINTADLINLGFISESKSNLGLTSDEIKKVRAKVIPANSIIMTCVGDLGIVSINQNEVVINQQLHSYQCQPLINNIFMMFCISLRKDYMYKMATLTTIPYMNKTTCNSIPVIIPPLIIQNQFAERVKAIEQQKVLIEKSIEDVQQLFDSTMDKYFH